VADLTVMATEKVIRRELSDEDHQRLIDESLEQAEFSRLSSARDSSDGHDGGGSR
jgi:hypothetical protein